MKLWSVVPESAPPPTPRKLDLKKDERLRVEWADGRESVYPLARLRQMCPCANCKILREGRDPHQLMRPMTAEEVAEAEGKSAKPAKKSLSLSVLPKHFASAADAPTVASAQLVGNYALKLVWSDGHDSGIYSFKYLRELDE